AIVRIHLGLLHALAGDWSELQPWLADEEDVHTLRALHAALEPRLRVQVRPTSSPGRLRRALRQLVESIERFNRRWRAHLSQVDLSAVNELRDKYNRYYLLEKECAVRSPRVARLGFRRLEPLTTAELTALLPPLSVPRLKARG